MELNNQQKNVLAWIILLVGVAFVGIIIWGIFSTHPDSSTTIDTPSEDTPSYTSTATTTAPETPAVQYTPTTTPATTPIPPQNVVPTTPGVVIKEPINSGAKMSVSDWTLFKQAGYCTAIASHADMQGVKAATFKPVVIKADQEAVKCRDGNFYTP